MEGQRIIFISERKNDEATPGKAAGKGGRQAVGKTKLGRDDQSDHATGTLDVRGKGDARRAIRYAARASRAMLGNGY